ncbi:tetratricopeptide repeat protein [Snodgrassella sp. CFCC 13594]|uniref:tetratricopeptide repeat protein n=1 Tax=Snodgrassella sp. CFCC 13594 TaxID=1775559 RepID=UPI00082E9B37|nr:tetratricopeptide repeat protein [Snodgrassella sp. CFCC 13594]
MRWQIAVAKGDIPSVTAGLPLILEKANDYALRRIFLQMAQLSLRDQSVAELAYANIHKSARSHTDMPEAMIADALFSALSGHQQDAVVALRHLADLDSQLQPATQLTLGLINVRQPQVLQAFFRQTDIRSLSPMWQSLYIDGLMSSNQLAKAYQEIQPLLTTSSSADLYLQAGFLSVNQKEPVAKTLDYLSKAYALGNSAQQSKAAFLAAMRLLDLHETREARGWANKIKDPSYGFDKALLLASLEGEEKHFQAAQQQLDAARRLKMAKGVFFDQDDLWRLQFLLLSRTTKPAQMLPQINRWLAEAQRTGQASHEASLLYQRGLIYADELRQPQKAVADLRRYNELKPDSAAGLNALGYSMLSLSKAHWVEAQQWIEQAYQLDSQSPAINDSLGWAYFLNGDAERALPYLQFAFREDPEPEVAAHLGEVLWQLGKRDEAKVIWQQGLNGEGDQRVLRATLRRLGVLLKPASMDAAVGQVNAEVSP